MAFRNQVAFDDPKSKLRAAGVDLRSETAITDPNGQVLAYAQTGGMLNPSRHTIPGGVTLFRFGSSKAGTLGVATGAWWLDRTAFDQLFSRRPTIYR